MHKVSVQHTKHSKHAQKENSYTNILILRKTQNVQCCTYLTSCMITKRTKNLHGLYSHFTIILSIDQLAHNSTTNYFQFHIHNTKIPNPQASIVLQILHTQNNHDQNLLYTWTWSRVNQLNSNANSSIQTFPTYFSSV